MPTARTESMGALQINAQSRKAEFHQKLDQQNQEPKKPEKRTKAQKFGKWIARQVKKAKRIPTVAKALRTGEATPAEAVFYVLAGEGKDTSNNSSETRMEDGVPTITLGMSDEEKIDANLKDGDRVNFILKYETQARMLKRDRNIAEGDGNTAKAVRLQKELDGFGRDFVISHWGDPMLDEVVAKNPELGGIRDQVRKETDETFAEAHSKMGDINAKVSERIAEQRQNKAQDPNTATNVDATVAARTLVVGEGTRVDEPKIPNVTVHDASTSQESSGDSGVPTLRVEQSPLLGTTTGRKEWNEVTVTNGEQPLQRPATDNDLNETSGPSASSDNTPTDASTTADTAATTPTAKDASDVDKGDDAEEAVDIPEEDVDEEIESILNDEDVEKLSAEMGRKLKIKKGQEFKLSKPERKDAFEAIGTFAKIKELRQLTGEAIPVAKARNRYIRARAVEIANSRTAKDIDADIKVVQDRELRTHEDVVNANIDLQCLEKAKILIEKGIVTEGQLDDATRGKVEQQVKERRQAMGEAQDTFNATLKNIEGKTSPDNKYINYLRNLPDLIQEYPDVGRVLEKIGKNARGKKQLILLLVILTLVALPVLDKLQALTQT